ncbi:hypothetical protein SAMN05892877_13720 [Rhizobium subbaraonis]|uniref:Uncharacterized protein n=1 Tax=Rhizobium subbaraonis TaxID=908946 RepID=A0A285V1Z2_9HYPH|nr:hypothetical protein [Rhizobium subbaraonis]SOC48079.1 hypothetical protein SAMN05892877_13720 [Rhizobium subbaraonis]
MAADNTRPPHTKETSLAQALDGKPHTLISRSPTSAVYIDGKGGQILLRGSGFEYDGDVAIKGTVTGATFLDRDGSAFLAWEL